MMKKVPMRTCISCGENKEKKALVRIVRTPEGEIHPDLTGRAQGRGCYLCKETACLESAIKKKSFSRAFKEAIPGEIVQKFTEEFKELCGEDYAG